MRTKVVGVTFSNEDGSSRARIIAGMSERDQICLERDPYNQYDANAVKVCVVKNGAKKQIGFLSKDIASDISSKLRRNVTFSVYVASVGTWNDRPFCELDITENSAPATTTTQRPVAPTGPTFNPTKTTTTSAPSPAFNPTRTTTMSAPSPTFNPTRTTTTSTPSPTFNPTRTTTTSTPSPTFNPTRTTTDSTPTRPVNTPTRPTTTVASDTTKKSVAAPTPSKQTGGDTRSNNSGCFGIIVGVVVLISALMMI